jgi:hypothetical protein
VTDQDVVQEARAVVSAWRELEGRRKEFSELINNWDLLVDFWKSDKGPDPQKTKRTLIRDLRKAEAQFWRAMKALVKTVG